ncbi:MAG: hypothetical protein GEU94_17200 [Micromonosporaceae bacterium]|nr:hypothetical protein [Micromonosporaceae bacterium]
MTVPPAPPAPSGAFAGAPKERPGVVTAACALMFVVAGISLIAAILGLMVLGPVRDAVENVRFDDPQVGAVAPQVVVWGLGVGIGFNLVVAVGLALLGLFNLRGSNGARVTTWVVVGLFLLCGVCGLLLQGVSGVTPIGGGGDPDSERLARAMEAATPSWYNSVSVGVALVDVLAYVAIVVLLALPAANEFFRKPAPQWEPPADYLTPPAGPAPGAPGAPTTPGTSGAPPASSDPWDAVPREGGSEPGRPPSEGGSPPPRES